MVEIGSYLELPFQWLEAIPSAVCCVSKALGLRVPGIAGTTTNWVGRRLRTAEKKDRAKKKKRVHMASLCDGEAWTVLLQSSILTHARGVIEDKSVAGLCDSRQITQLL